MLNLSLWTPSYHTEGIPVYHPSFDIFSTMTYLIAEARVSRTKIQDTRDPLEARTMRAYALCLHGTLLHGQFMSFSLHHLMPGDFSVREKRHATLSKSQLWPTLSSIKGRKKITIYFQIPTWNSTERKGLFRTNRSFLNYNTQRPKTQWSPARIEQTKNTVSYNNYIYSGFHSNSYYCFLSISYPDTVFYPQNSIALVFPSRFLLPNIW